MISESIRENNLTADLEVKSKISAGQKSLSNIKPSTSGKRLRWKLGERDILKKIILDFVNLNAGIMIYKVWSIRKNERKELKTILL